MMEEEAGLPASHHLRMETTAGQLPGPENAKAGHNIGMLSSAQDPSACSEKFAAESTAETQRCSILGPVSPIV